jgi:hypothetical protein
LWFVVVVMVHTDDLPKFKLEEYIEYLQAPQWAKEGCESEAEYHSEICARVKKWYDQSAEAFRQEKQTWKICYDLIENTAKNAVQSGLVTEDAIAQGRIPILKNTMLDEVAALYGGQYVPVLKAIAEPVQPLIALANQYLRIGLKLNAWESLKFDLGLDGFVCDLWVLKIYTDDEEPGPFGENERIVLDRIDPMNCYFDPEAKRLQWSAMDFFIVEESLDIGVARNRFKDAARLITKDLAEPAGTERSKSSGILTLPGTRERWASGSERARLKIKECWFHDERMQFRAYKDDTPNGEVVRVGEDGYVEGEWEKAYPNGRMVVTCADQVVLRDCGNPYWHDGLPFEFCRMTPSTKLISVGKAASILGIERRVNDIESRVHSYAQAEIERPMQADTGALVNNIAWYKTTGQSRAILIKNAGKAFVRPAPVEVPSFLIPYIGRLSNYRNEIAGQGGILRGEIPEGANLAAETIQSVQGLGMSRLSMQSVMISQAMRNVGEKYFWLMRETFKTGLKAKVYTPTGQEIEVEWDEKAIGNEFFVDVDIAANTPGGQQAMITNAVSLKREGIVDRPYVLQTIGIEGWEQIDQRMRQKELEDIQTQGFGRSLGVQVKSMLQDAQKQPGPAEKR